MVLLGSFFLGATDLTESPQTNRMIYHKTIFCIQLETKKSKAKFFFQFSKIRIFKKKISKIRDFQMIQYGYEMKLEEILRLMAEKKISKIKFS